MDHHCLFLYTCIGFYNYKFFILTLVYGNILLVLMDVTLIQSLSFYINEYGDNLILTIYCLIYFFMILLTALLVYFLYLHISLLVSNLTTIDYMEKSRDNESKYVFINIFDLGGWRNFKSVMGGFFTWFLPIGKKKELRLNLIF